MLEIVESAGRDADSNLAPEKLKRAHVPARPVMPALPHGLEILTAQHRLKFCTRHSPFDRVDGDQTEPLKADQAPTAAAEKFLFATRSILGGGIASVWYAAISAMPSFTAPYQCKALCGSSERRNMS